MAILFSLLGSLGVLGLTAAGLLLMVAPSWGLRVLKHAAAAIVLFVLSIVLVQMLCSALRGCGPWAFLLTVIVVSPIAYLIRAHRLRRPERPQRLRSVERTPVMPRRIPGGR